MTSPVGSLFNAIPREASQRYEGAVFIDDDFRQRLPRGVFDAGGGAAAASGLTAAARARKR